MTRQDDTFETAQCDAFKLKHIGRRGSTYIPDALTLLDGKIYRGELKSCDEDRGCFSTSSRMGMDKIDQWKGGFDWAIFSTFTEGNIKESYFLAHEHLQPFYEKVIKKQMAGHAGRAGLSAWLNARKVLEQSNFTGKKMLDKLEKQNKFGSRINDPGISMQEIREWGVKINNKNPHSHVEALIKEYCSDRGWEPKEIDLLRPPKGFTYKKGVCPSLESVITEWREP